MARKRHDAIALYFSVGIFLLLCVLILGCAAKQNSPMLPTSPQVVVADMKLGLTVAYKVMATLLNTEKITAAEAKEIQLNYLLPIESGLLVLEQQARAGTLTSTDELLLSTQKLLDELQKLLEQRRKGAS